MAKATRTTRTTKAAKANDTATTDKMANDAPIWEKHVFVCTSGSWCPAVDGDGLGVHARLKALVKQAELGGRVRINHAGCFDQCGHGPMVVVYPENVWYARVTPEDAEEILTSHLIGGQPVERLRYRATPGKHKLPRDAEGHVVAQEE
jgi:(2Fe-2S) ferredoxin